MEEIPQTKDYEKELVDLHRNLQSSAKWFYWIGALSVINTIIIFFEGNVSFIVGLGLTQLVDGFFFEASANARLIGLFINIIISGIFAGFGYFASKLEKWAFIFGMILYLIDGLLFLMISDWLSLGFHGFVLLSLFAGLKSLWKIEKLQTEQDCGIARLEKELSKT